MIQVGPDDLRRNSLGQLVVQVCAQLAILCASSMRMYEFRHMHVPPDMHMTNEHVEDLQRPVAIQSLQGYDHIVSLL